MKIKRFNESIESIKERLDKLTDLWAHVNRTHRTMTDIYDPKAYPELTEINREFNDLVVRLRKFDRLLGEEIEKV
jgi:hypothetical protein